MTPLKELSSHAKPQSCKEESQYVNHTLSAAKRATVETWLKTERRAPTRLARSAWWLGSPVAVVLLMVLWAVVQPGIALRRRPIGA